MTWQLLVSQGRVADRSTALLEGSAQISEMLQSSFDLTAQVVGCYEVNECVSDDWQHSLQHASPHLTLLSQAVEQVLLANNTVLAVHSTCATSLASLPQAVKHFPEIKLLRLDAHADFNTPQTTGSGHLSGMVLAELCGRWQGTSSYHLDTKNVMLVGVRELDDAEGKLLAQSQIASIQQIDIEKILTFIGASPVWIHIDWDVLDQGYLPDYNIKGGLTPSELAQLLQCIPKHQLKGIELAEYYAAMDSEQKIQDLQMIESVVRGVLEHKAE